MKEDFSALNRTFNIDGPRIVEIYEDNYTPIEYAPGATYNYNKKSKSINSYKNNNSILCLKRKDKIIKNYSNEISRFDIDSIIDSFIAENLEKQQDYIMQKGFLEYVANRKKQYKTL